MQQALKQLLPPGPGGQPAGGSNHRGQLRGGHVGQLALRLRQQGLQGRLLLLLPALQLLLLLLLLQGRLLLLLLLAALRLCSQAVQRAPQQLLGRPAGAQWNVPCQARCCCVREQ